MVERRDASRREMRSLERWTRHSLSTKVEQGEGTAAGHVVVAPAAPEGAVQKDAVARATCAMHARTHTLASVRAPRIKRVRVTYKRARVAHLFFLWPLASLDTLGGGRCEYANAQFPHG